LLTLSSNIYDRRLSSILQHAMRSKADAFPTDLDVLATQAKALSHPARFAILQTLVARAKCVCGDLADDLPLAQSTVSRHLKVLKEAGLVQGTVDGPRVCYCLNDTGVSALQTRLRTFSRTWTVPGLRPPRPAANAFSELLPDAVAAQPVVIRFMEYVRFGSAKSTRRPTRP
jgi:DNA-binding transcriptional ArsR family regulator